jgi:peptide-methionine (S)-S-oxide reductase
MLKYLPHAFALFTLTAGSIAMAQNNNNQIQNNRTEQAVFASGCFWCTEKDFDEVDGVIETISGYAGGDLDNPTYEQVTGGSTGHHEATKVVFDPNQVTYGELLNVYWKNVDPFDDGGQFCDRGSSYRPAIFALNDDQLAAARNSIQAKQAEVDQEIAVKVEKIDEFWPAEDYHQNYYKKNPIRYKFYRWNCGRDQRLEEIQAEYGDVF